MEHGVVDDDVCSLPPTPTSSSSLPIFHFLSHKFSNHLLTKLFAFASLAAEFKSQTNVASWMIRISKYFSVLQWNLCSSHLNLPWCEVQCITMWESHIVRYAAQSRQEFSNWGLISMVLQILSRFYISESRHGIPWTGENEVPSYWKKVITFDWSAQSYTN